MAFIHLDNDRTQRLIDAYRTRYTRANIPSTNVEWAMRDKHRQEVLGEILTKDIRERMGRHAGLRAEVQDVMRQLTDGEPRNRAVGPVVVSGTQASVPESDIDGYLQATAGRDAAT